MWPAKATQPLRIERPTPIVTSSSVIPAKAGDLTLSPLRTGEIPACAGMTIQVESIPPPKRNHPERQAALSGFIARRA
jgi:hypothetical protein